MLQLVPGADACLLFAVQLASKAQKASVTPEEVQRYIAYDKRHGAKYIEYSSELAAAADDDEW